MAFPKVSKFNKSILALCLSVIIIFSVFTAGISVFNQKGVSEVHASVAPLVVAVDSSSPLVLKVGENVTLNANVTVPTHNEAYRDWYDFLVEHTRVVADYDVAKISYFWSASPVGGWSLTHCNDTCSFMFTELTDQPVVVSVSVLYENAIVGSGSVVVLPASQPETLQLKLSTPQGESPKLGAGEVLPISAEVSFLSQYGNETFPASSADVVYSWTVTAHEDMVLNLDGAQDSYVANRSRSFVGNRVLNFSFASASEAEVWVHVEASSLGQTAGYTIVVVDPAILPAYYLGASTATASYIINADNHGWYYGVNGTSGLVVDSFTSTNPTIPINNALSIGQGKVVVNSGFFNCTGGQIIIPETLANAGPTSVDYANLVFEGQGVATVLYTKDSDTNLIVFNGTQNSVYQSIGCTVQNFWVSSSTTSGTGAGNGIYLEHSQFIKIFNTVISGFGNTSIYNNGGSNIWIENNQLQYCNYGIHTTGHDSTIYNNKITNMAAGAIIRCGDTNLYSMNTFEDLENPNGVMFVLSGSGNTITNNFFNSQAARDISKMMTTSGATYDNIIAQNHFYGPAPNNASTVSYAITLSSASSYIVTDNIISGFAVGLDLVSVGTINNTFSKNTIKACTVYTIYGHSSASPFNYFKDNYLQGGTVYPYNFFFTDNYGYNDLPNMHPIIAAWYLDGTKIGDGAMAYTHTAPTNNTVATNYGAPKIMYGYNGVFTEIRVNGAIMFPMGNFTFITIKLSPYQTMNVTTATGGTAPTWRVEGD